MKTYQFITLAALLALIVAGMLYKGKKKKSCACSSTPAPLVIDTEDGE